MEIFRMSDVLSLLHLPVAPQGKSSYYIKCPCCDDKPSSRHLNINLVKGVFRCARCGVSGGIFDIYALYTGTSREKVRDILVEQIGTNSDIILPRKEIPLKEIEECPLTDLETRHATYSALLSKLSLASDHRTNLLGRGLLDEEIYKAGYRTTPVVGLSAIAQQLLSEGYYLAGVPGFYRDQSGSWTFIKERRGIMIPVRDHRSMIQGIQIRRDNVSKRKFRWVSSVGLSDGCKAVGWTHLAGDIRHRVIITEGPMKADIIHALTGMTVLAVPGVNALTQLEEVLVYLKQHGVEEIKTAFDMDFMKNPHVQEGYDKLLNLIDEMGFRFGIYVWDSRYNGLDDYIWENLCKKRRYKG